MAPIFNQQDRDTLIRVDQKLDDLIIRLFGTNGDKGVIPLMQVKVDAHEAFVNKVGGIHKATWVGAGIVAFLVSAATSAGGGIISIIKHLFK